MMAATTTIFTCSIDTPLGPMTASAEDNCLSGLWFKGQKYFPPAAGWQTNPDYPVFKTLRAWLTEYFAGKKMDAPGKDGLSGKNGPSGNDDPYRALFNFKPTGTDFQKRVWKALVKIPYGKLSSYGAIARQLGSQPRAVGGAVGHNPISILVPCHRVVGSGGKLTGYAGGLDRKKALLELEGSWEA